MTQGKSKEVILLCGKEFRYWTSSGEGHKGTYRAIPARGTRQIYTVPERRSGKERRKHPERRKQRDMPRNFRLERRRLSTDRRNSRGRCRDD
jgi:hypothetical protein